MKKKVGTVLDEGTMRLAKRHAAENGVPLSGVIQEALEAYLNGAKSEPKKRLEAFKQFCGNPIKLSASQLQAVLDADTWG